KEIWRSRRREAIRRTLLKRPDLLEKAPLSGEDMAILNELCSDGYMVKSREEEDESDTSS
ncbi:MAG TPA: hypothetical protein VEJ88_08610, partial [Dissulfurispiraceae bacterium]|nr:hypothetical protein [Dissulfurispiraceae bacterium]